METRKITIVSTKTQKRHVVETNATTLAELKAALRSNGIDYEGMTFYEGLTKTELKTDESLLPHDVMRRGVVTNELAFMLSPAQKKIKSGMDRKEAYAYIKGNNLGNECLKKFGKNFTMCKTDDLIKIVESHKKSLSPVENIPSVKEPVVKSEPEVEPATPTNSNTDSVYSALSYLVEHLEDEGIISESAANTIKSILNGAEKPVSSSSDSPYSKSELDEMFSGMMG